MTPNTSQNFIYSALPTKKNQKKKQKKKTKQKKTKNKQTNFARAAAAAKKIVWTPKALLKILEEMPI